MKTIIVATDFSDAAKNAAFYAADMAKSTNAALLLFHVYKIPASYSQIPIKKVREDMGLENVKVMIPFCRTIEEGYKVIDVMR